MTLQLLILYLGTTSKYGLADRMAMFRVYILDGLAIIYLQTMLMACYLHMVIRIMMHLI